MNCTALPLYGLRTMRSFFHSARTTIHSQPRRCDQTEGLRIRQRVSTEEPCHPVPGDNHSRRRWFGTHSCKPVPRGPPSSVKQLRTTWPLGLSHSWHTMFMASGSGECSTLTINIGRKPVKGREGKIHGTDNCFS